AELETTVPQTEDDDAPLELDDSYTFESIMEDGAFFSSAELESILSTLTRKRNIILQGPPGTGKTWLGRRLGWALCGRKSNTLVSVVQFHPSFSYEDFVRGWRPSSAGKLELTDGLLSSFVVKLLMILRTIMFLCWRRLTAGIQYRFLERCSHLSKTPSGIKRTLCVFPTRKIMMRHSMFLPTSFSLER